MIGLIAREGEQLPCPGELHACHHSWAISLPVRAVDVLGMVYSHAKTPSYSVLDYNGGLRPCASSSDLPREAVFTLQAPSAAC